MREPGLSPTDSGLVLPVLVQLCSMETLRSQRRAAGASPLGPPPGRSPAPATKNPAAAPKRMSTTRFSTQQVKAPAGQDLAPPRQRLTPRCQVDGGGGPSGNLPRNWKGVGSAGWTALRTRPWSPPTGVGRYSTAPRAPAQPLRLGVAEAVAWLLSGAATDSR